MSETLIKVSEIKKDHSNIKVKTYLPFTIKKMMVDGILKSIVKENSYGMKTIDYPFLELVKQYTLVNNYSNINLTEVTEIIDTYDQLKGKGIIDHVIGKIPQNEFDFFEDVLFSEIQQIKEVDNSIQSIISQSLNKIVNKIPDEKGLSKLIKLLPKEINKIDSSKLQNILETIKSNGKPKV